MNGNRWRRRRRRKKTTAELSAQLAPLEEQQEAKQQQQPQPPHDGRPADDGTIRVDTAALKVPKKLVEDEREGADIFRLDPVVLVILILMLSFILFIAWQVARMPPPAK